MTMLLTFCIFTTMFSTTVMWVKADKTELQTLHRQKRGWLLPAIKLMENEDHSKKEYIINLNIEENRSDILYSLIEGKENLFSIDRKRGYVKVHGILDREKKDAYELKARVSLPDGSLFKKDLNLKIMVLDQNDNAPELEHNMKGFVEELSDTDTVAFTVKAKDKDQEGTPHSKISYNIIQQDPAGEMMMFKIDRSSGEIKVRINTLDREKLETYSLIITATDMDGIDSNPNDRPMTGTGIVTITILDVNDNIPTLENMSYEGSVEENIKNKEVIRIKTIDKDKEYTENWEAVYTIISGNEAGHFTISTDPKTNEGILMVTKELNYEEVKEISMKVVVNNKAPYHKSVVNDRITEYPIKIKVKNVREAPYFQPAVKDIKVSEDPKVTDLSKVITTYTAIDTDTNSTASNVMYLKGEDAEQWVSIDEQKGEIRLIKYPDHESEYVKNGIYYVKILAITDDFSPKTATGTLAIHVEDINDNAPILTSSVAKMCSKNSEVYVTANDADNPPNAAPFNFILASEGAKEKWSLEDVNDKTKMLSSQEILWPGHYTVELEVKDQQGKSSGVQKLKVIVCKCLHQDKPDCPLQRKKGTSIVLGVFGVLALLLGVLLLLSVSLMLLICDCGGGVGGFQDFPYDQKQNLMIYHTEGQGEDKHDLTMLSQVPVYVDGGGGRSDVGFGWESHEYWRKYGFRSEEEYLKQKWYLEHGHHVDHKKTGMVEQTDFYTESSFSSTALSAAFFSKYYTTKTLELMNQEAAVDHLLVSGYEDCISVTSSFEDISSHLHEETNLDFLDDLGPHFSKLAEICS